MIVNADETQEFHEALRQAGDMDRRLAGEDLQTMHVDDARHWETVYRELNAFKLGVLSSAQERGSSVSSDGQQEVGNDLTILRAEAERLGQRLRYWEARREQLEGRDG